MVAAMSSNGRSRAEWSKISDMIVNEHVGATAIRLDEAEALFEI